MTREEPARTGGLPAAIGAYLIWGLLPLYLLLLRHVPAFELVGWRVIFTVPVCLLIVVASRQGKQLRAAIGNPRALAMLTASAAIIGINWVTYFFAIQDGHVFAASLGYYINPLVNVLAGTVFLKERLSRMQWVAVGIAAIGVSLLAWGARETLGISLALAISFAAYGLIRKLAPVESLPGLTIESLVLLLPASAIVGWYAMQPAGSNFGHGPGNDALIASSGVITAAPLLLFAAAARRMSYSALGFVQYLAPTIVFLLGVFVFGEPLRTVQLVCFLFIWTAIVLFSWDLWSRRKSKR